MRARRSSSSSSGSAASRTRPIDVAYAGRRVPTASVMLMIRRVGTRATYTISVSSSTDSDDDSLIAATSASMWGSAISGRLRLDRNAKPSSSTRGRSEKRLPSKCM
jgi:hypothetical protein